MKKRFLSLLLACFLLLGTLPTTADAENAAVFTDEFAGVSADVTLTVSGANVLACEYEAEENTLHLTLGDAETQVTLSAETAQLQFLAGNQAVDVSGGSGSVSFLIYAENLQDGEIITVNLTVSQGLYFSKNLRTKEVKYAVGAVAESLTVEAVGEGEVTYQWFSVPDVPDAVEAPIEGAAAASYTPSTDAAGTTFYFVIACCGDLMVVSNVAAVTVVEPAVTFTKDLSETEVFAVQGQPAEALTVEAVHSLDAPITYQWFADGAAIEGATQADYTPSTENVGTVCYYVAAAAGEQSAVSKTAKITVTQGETVLERMEITAQPAKTAYRVGEAVDLTGLEVTAVYSGGITRAVTDYTFAPAIIAGDTAAVTVTWSGMTAEVPVALILAERLEITALPAKTAYTAGENFDPAGMVVKVHYADGTSQETTAYTVSPAGPLTTADAAVTLTYSGEDGAATLQPVTVPISVTANIPTQSQPAAITVYMTYVNRGAIVVQDAPVTVYDEDGDNAFCIGEAFRALHRLYYPGGESGYWETSNAYVSGWVTQFWGGGVAGFVYALNRNWARSTKDPIANGSHVAAISGVDTELYSDLYTWFDTDSAAVAGENVTLKVNGLNLMGSNASYNALHAPYGATVTVTDSLGREIPAMAAAVGQDGTFTLCFAEAGTYTVTVSGTAAWGSYQNAPVAPCTCTVTVSPAPERPNTDTEALKAETPQPEKKPAFTDVAETDYFYAAVNWAAEKGITTGTGEGVFSPKDVCTRGQMVTFLWRAMGKAQAAETGSFADADKNAFYYHALLWAVEKGITTGTGAGTFGPDEACTRGQMVTFLWRLAGKPQTETACTFTDVTEGDYFHTAVAWAAEAGITTGTSEGVFSPNAACTRGQMVTFLHRYMTTAEKE